MLPARWRVLKSLIHVAGCAGGFPFSVLQRECHDIVLCIPTDYNAKRISAGEYIHAAK